MRAQTRRGEDAERCHEVIREAVAAADLNDLLVFLVLRERQEVVRRTAGNRLFPSRRKTRALRGELRFERLILLVWLA